jgi:hypothetical protein
MRFGELYCLVTVAGFEHGFALLQSQIHGVTGGGKILGQLRVPGVAA